MPMDIRMFFKGKGTVPSKSKDAPAATTNRENKASAPKNDTETTKAWSPTATASERKSETKGRESPRKRDSTSKAGDRVEVSTEFFFKQSPAKKLKAAPAPPVPCKATETKAQESIDSDSSAEDDRLLYNTKRTLPTTTNSARKTKREESEQAAESVELEPVSKKASPAPRSTTPKAKRTPASTAKTTKRDSPVQPSRTATSIDSDSLVPECLKGYTFVCSGILPNLGRDDCEDLIKTLGGRVTGAVSGKTDYLVVGNVLEDGRPYTEGSKYKKAVEKNIFIVNGEEELYGLMLQYDEKLRAERGLAERMPVEESQAPPSVASVNAPKVMPDVALAAAKPSVSSVPAAAAATKPMLNPYSVSNPYTTKPASANPYAVASNPYIKSRSSDAPGTVAPPIMDERKPSSVASQNDTTNQLWVDKYKPSSSDDILGNTDMARKLKLWLDRWENRFNNPQSYDKSFSNPQGPWKAALLSGPPGIGKTTTAIVVANESGRDCIEFNASDVRSKKSLTEGIGDVTGSRTLEFGKKNKGVTEATRKKRVIIMDEVDGMGGGDRGGMAELIQLIKHSRVPIICICNDRQAQKMKSLIPYCMDLRCRRPVKTVIARRAMEIARREGMVVEQNAAEAIAESCGNDVRQVINCMQMWANSHKSGKSTMTYKDVKEREKSINKDEILRVSLFDAAKMVLEGPKGLINADLKAQRDSFFKRNDAFFVDYSFVGLIVQQNYLKLLQHPYSEAKRGGNNDEVQKVLERMYSASESMSDYAVAELALRGGQNWSLLPFTGLLTVKTGFHAAGELGGFLPGYPEFTTYLGRNSTKGKKERLLSEIRHHTNFKVSGTMQELRSNYLPVLHEKIMTAIQKDDGVNEALDIMDGYGLDRDDVMEKFDEFVLDTKQAKFGKLDTKKKSEFTRLYNQRSHTSQALVAEQGASKTSKRAKKSRKSDMAVDPDAIDDDAMLDDEEDDADDDDEIDEAKVKAMFGKKKGKTTTVAAKTRTASKKATATKGKKTK